MNFLRPSALNTRLVSVIASRAMTTGGIGSGAGKGGGAGGSIREAGGAFGEQAAAREDQYFHNQEVAQMKKLKEALTDEIGFHEEQIKRHQDAINRHKQRIGSFDKH